MVMNMVPATRHSVAHRAMRLSMMMLISVLMVQAIYPDDHWNYATQLTEANFDTFVQDNIQGGKTVFVRWIASP